MKTVYIPKGKTVVYESLVTDCLVVEGYLNVTYGVKARTISGNGVICAGTISADDIRAGELEAASITCDRLLAKRVQCPEIFATESAAVSGFLSAAYVGTGKLTVAISEVDEVNADEVVHLTPKRRGLFGLLLASALRSLWTALTVKAAPGEAMDTECKPVNEVTCRQSLEPEPAKVEEEPVDVELNRFIGMFKLARESGYTLKLVPGTPEENAPVFPFEKQKAA